MMDNHLDLTPTERWKQLRLLQDAYPEFNEFLYDVITGLMGFDCTPNQIDMSDYLQHGNQYRMIQAQRGQAKTTVTAAYAVWRLINDPTTRVLIVSSGDKMAKEISNWIIQIINGMEELSCLRPDRAAGDRASVEAFDVHYALKGAEKSPSVACMGITGNMQGKRADVLIADDIESQKNSATAEMRERLIHLSRDFTSINSKGDIIYLGTPQSVDSIYNSLPGRGFDIRIWPGRYPTEAEIDNYGPHLAPMIRTAIEADPSLRGGGGMDGTRGKPTDNVILGEDVLVKKEIDQGAAYFQLQHMLDTRLSDADRFPLKLSKITFMQVPVGNVPIQVFHQAAPANLILTASDYPVNAKFYRAAGFSNEFGAFQGTHMYVDPAGGGQNGDETAYAVTKFSAGRVFLVDIGGVPGGIGEDNLDMLTQVAAKWKPERISIEKNYGNGALSNVWQPLLFRKHQCEIEDVWESGQKELRIIDTLE
ncbi:phage terminase large subunit, partial [Octadecabacter sp.]|nr:phage terminase large subunit [Octadecabacter sp.]